MDAGIDHRFVGTMTEGSESTAIYPDHQGKAFENRHEARWGSTTEGRRDKLREVSGEWTADLALIYLGTNREKLTDEEKETDPAGVARTARAMRELLEILRANNPRMIVALRLPVGDDSRALGLTEAYRKIARFIILMYARQLEVYGFNFFPSFLSRVSPSINVPELICS